MTDAFALTGKVAVVTGSTRGIGLAIATALRRAGAQVVVSSEDAAECAEVAKTIGACGIGCDVTDQDALRHLVTATADRFGGIDILVANAGIPGAPGSWDDDDFDTVMAINLRSQVALTSLALPMMIERPGANAILMSSISGLRGNAAINAYALAKAGVAQLARNLAVQWGPCGIRVNALSPGLIATGFSQPLLADAAFMDRRMQMTPLRRAGTADEVANAALFLASPAAGFVTGHNLVVDGGTIVTDGS